MKYFTYELWKDLNSSDELIRNRADQNWMDNINIYKEELKNAKKKLTKRFLNILDKNIYFHDYYLSNIKIQQKNTGNHSIKLSLVLTLYGEDWEIVYKNVAKVNINYSYDKKELDFRNGFGTWGYCEFFEVDEKLLSHEILFSSGATILIIFEKVQAVKLKKDDYKL